MNIISIKEDQFKKIYNWVNKNEGITNKFYPYLLNGEIHQTFNDLNVETIIVFNVVEDSDGGHTICLHLEGAQSLNIDNDKLFSITFRKSKDGELNAVTTDTYTSPAFLKNVLGEQADDYASNVGSQLIAGYSAINAYLFHYKQDISEVEEKVVERHTIKVKGRYKQQLIKKVNKRYTITGDISNRKVAKKHQWHIDSWGVVGHFRTISSGKRVYVRPYIKGKGKVEDKIFII